MEEEIRLVNEIIANAVIHGADGGGSYDQNRYRLGNAINDWIKAKGIENDYHVIMKEYFYEPDDEETSDAPYDRELAGIWTVPTIVPVSEKAEGYYKDYFDMK